MSDLVQQLKENDLVQQLKELNQQRPVAEAFSIEKTKEFKEAEERRVERETKIKLIKDRLGKEIVAYLQNPNVIEVMLNQDMTVWVEEFGKDKYQTDIVYTIDNAISLMELIATQNKTTFTYKEPIIAAVLPDGERFAGMAFDICGNSAAFAIRKRSEKIFSLDDYVSQGIISLEQANKIKGFIKAKKNILIVGGTSSGKTTFVNACLKELNDTNDRIFNLEDTPELQCQAKNLNFLRTNDYTHMVDLVRFCMRANPDRIIIGELRAGRESLELLKAWNSGHPGGFATIHANSSAAGIQKLKQYLGEETESDQSPVIAEGVQIVVTLIKDPETNKRILKEIKELKGFDDLTKKFDFGDV